MNEVIYDADGDPVGMSRPAWRFSWFDMASTAVFLVGGVAKTLGQGLDMLGREFAAAANYGRDRKDWVEREAWAEKQRARANQEMVEILGLPEADPADIPAAER